MPIGEFEYSVDDKGRVVIPPNFRDFVRDGIVVTRGMDGCLNVFPMTTWKEIETTLTNLPITDAQSRNFVRFFYSGATRANTDAAERITLPAGLRAYAGITNNVVVAGAPNRLEDLGCSQMVYPLGQCRNAAPNP